jgi:hemolysin activation/secretion protein
MSDSTQHRQVVAACALLLASYASVAQTTPDAGSLLRESERQQPRLPQSVPKVAPLEKPPTDTSAVRIQVKAFSITGNTLIAEPQLQKALVPWVGKELSFTELQQATNAISEVYRQRGWFARVQLLPQDVSSGTITIAIIESKLGELRIDDGGKPLRMQRDLVTGTMTERQKPGDPLNLDALERSSNILNDTPGVVVATILASGKTAGDTDAVVKVQDKPLVSTSVQLDNTGSRSTGDKKISAGLTLDNPSGTGDQISLNANGGEGNLYAKLAYSLPVGRDGLRAGLSASALTYKLVGPDFEALASKGDGQTIGANTSYPLLRSSNRNIGVAAALDRKTYYNEANGLATSRKTIYAGLLSVTGDMLDGLGAGGMTLWGANITLGNTDLSGNATNQTADQNGPNTAGSYSKLGYNLARLQRLSENATLWFAFNGQTAFKNLDSSEKMSLGGPSGVRAYPVMEGTGDKGWLATLEGRYNITSDVQLVAFYDHGSIQRDFDASYTGALLPTTADLKGAGVAVGWSRPGQFTLRATLARRMGDNPLSTPATGLDQDGSLTHNRLWLNAIAYF